MTMEVKRHLLYSHILERERNQYKAMKRSWKLKSYYIKIAFLYRWKNAHNNEYCLRQVNCC